MRLAYLGTPEMASGPLTALVAAGHDVALVVTNPDRRRGRGTATSPSPVKTAALGLGLDVTDEVDDLLALGPPAELGVVVAFGRLLRPHVLARLPMVNVHFSLLPRWRGAAPVERAVLAGDDRTGVCLMAVEEGLDTGAVYRRAEVAIGPDTTADELRASLVELGTGLLVAALEQGLGPGIAQQGETTYARKLSPEDLRLEPALPAVDLHRRVRAGGAWTTWRGGRLKVWRSALPPAGDGPVLETPTGPLELVEVQPEGRARMSGPAWANGARWARGDAFGG